MTRRSITTTTLALAFVASATVAAIPAQAETSARVAYADLDLGSAAGQRTLARRLSSAVSRVCPTEAGDWAAAQDCRLSALGRAHADLARVGVTSN